MKFFNETIKATGKWMVLGLGRPSPKYFHDSYDSAETEAKRLAAIDGGVTFLVVKIRA